MAKKKIYDYYSSQGKKNIKATRSDFTDAVGEEGLKDIIRKVLEGGNVRDITEFITQRRLMNSYVAMLDLYTSHIGDYCISPGIYAEYVSKDLLRNKGDARILDLWLLGLTKKGLDNIVRSEENIIDYKVNFSKSIEETTRTLEDKYGELSGIVEYHGKKLDLNWRVLMMMLLSVGSQTLSIRGSAKSMNGKLFEKLVLGSLISIMGFKFLPSPPAKINLNDKCFWLSHMDYNERETDATIVFNGKAISIDIGFIGRGNPEITLDKVTRFSAYKEIGGIDHNMSTVIIVDTVGEGSDLFNKAKRVNGHVLQMKEEDWTILFAKIMQKEFGIKHELANMSVDDLDSYFKEKMNSINLNKFIL